MAQNYRADELFAELDELGVDYESPETAEIIEPAAREILDLIEEIGDNFDEIIADENFEDEAKRYARDHSGMDDAGDFPYNYVDWEAAAEDLKSDYAEVDFRGSTYYYKAY